MNKFLDHWLSLSEPEFLKVLKWTSEPLLFKVMQNDVDGKLRARIQQVLPQEDYERLCRRACLSRRGSVGKKAA